MYFWFHPKAQFNILTYYTGSTITCNRRSSSQPFHAQQSKETSTGISLPCGQGTPTTPTDSQIPAQPDSNTNPQGTSANNLQVHTQQQNVVSQQQSPLPQPQFPNPDAVPTHPQPTHPHVTPQVSTSGQQSPIRMQTNPLSQHSITAPEAVVSNTPEQKIPKSINGEGVKNSRKQVTTSTTNAQDSKLCFRCKQTGHLKKDCPELPYCSKCQTLGHIPVKCPTKQQDSRQ